MFDESVTYEKPPSVSRADRGPLELFVPKFNLVFARTDGHPRSSWTRHALHHDGEDDSMFDESVTYEEPPSVSRADRGPLELFVLKFKPGDIYYQLEHPQEPPRPPFYRGASFVFDVRGFVNGLCARDFVGVFSTCRAI